MKLEIPGLPSLGVVGTLTAGAALIIAWMTSAAWIADHEVAKCNSEWSKQISEANKDLEEKLRKAEASLRKLDEEKLKREGELLLQLSEAKTEVEKQREAIKLSEQCTACRVPNEWIWVRPKPVRPDGTKGGTQGGAAAQSSRVPDAKAAKSLVP